MSKTISALDVFEVRSCIFITNICVFTITVAKMQTDMLNLCKNFLQRRATLSTEISATSCLKTYILLQYVKYCMSFQI